MELSEQIINAKRMLVHLAEYYNTGVLVFHPDDKAIMDVLYRSIYHVTPNLGCPSCLLAYLQNLSSWVEINEQVLPAPAPAPVEVIKKSTRKKK